MELIPGYDDWKISPQVPVPQRKNCIYEDISRFVFLLKLNEYEDEDGFEPEELYDQEELPFR